MQSKYSKHWYHNSHLYNCLKDLDTNSTYLSCQNWDYKIIISLHTDSSWGSVTPPPFRIRDRIYLEPKVFFTQRYSTLLEFKPVHLHPHTNNLQRQRKDLSHIFCLALSENWVLAVYWYCILHDGEWPHKEISCIC